ADFRRAVVGGRLEVGDGGVVFVGEAFEEAGVDFGGAGPGGVGAVVAEVERRVVEHVPGEVIGQGFEDFGLDEFFARLGGFGAARGGGAVIPGLCEFDVSDFGGGGFDQGGEF